MNTEKTIQKILTKLDGKTVPYSKIGPMMRSLTKDYDKECSLYDVQEYVHLTRTVNDVVKGPTKVEYDEPTNVVMRKDSLEAIELLSENEKQKLCKELKRLRLYIYIYQKVCGHFGILFRSGDGHRYSGHFDLYDNSKEVIMIVERAFFCWPSLGGNEMTKDKIKGSGWWKFGYFPLSQ